MDRNRFDELTKTAANETRRSLLKASIGAVFGGVIGLAGLKSASAARKRANGVTCRADSDCLLDNCGSWDEKHHRGKCEVFCEFSINGGECIT